jgi:uncharacterized protein YjbJ (UPF0337 family)
MRKEVLLGITTAFVLLAGLSTHVALAQNMTTNASNAMGNATENAKDTMSGLKENATNAGQNLMDKAGQVLSNITGAIKEGIGTK